MCHSSRNNTAGFQPLDQLCTSSQYKRVRGTTGADDRARTGDLDLGKVALYQLSYVRVVNQL